jgi:hypothetical protein
MHPVRLSLSAVLLAVAAALPLRGQASPTVDPCTLLTAAEVSQALGIKSLPGRPFLGSKRTCFFSADTGYSGAGPSVSVMVMTPAEFQNQGHMAGALAGRPLSGLGDEAWVVSSGSYVKVGVRKGARAFSVTIARGETGKATPAQVEAMEKALAQEAVARL